MMPSPLARALTGGALVLALLLPALRAQETVPASADAGPAVRALQPGELVPDFTVLGPDNRPVKLSDFRGKRVLLDIWATWCGPCVAAIPHNSELAEKHAADDLVVLAVCASDTRANYDGWVQRNRAKYKFLTAHDPAGRDWKASVFNTQYGVTGFPTMFLIDREGRLVGQASGGGAGENPHVTRLLAKGGIPVDTSHLPPEPAPGERQSVPMVGKTPALMGMGGGMTAAAPAGSRLGTLAAGELVPAFAVPAADGRELRPADFQGRVTILTFFSNSERGPEAFAVAAAEKYRAQGVELFAVATAQERAQFDAFVARARPAYALGWDPTARAYMEGVAHMQFGIGMFPAIGVMDRAGRLVGGFIGMGERNAGLLHSLLLKAGITLAEEDRPKAVAAAAIVAPPAPAAPAAAKPATLAAGAVAPDFVMQDVAGKQVRLSDFKGKVVVLDFWATWCGPCIASFPHTQDLARKYRDQDVVVLASGTSDTIEKFKEWIPRNQPKYPDMVWAFDPHERGSPTFEERAASKLYGVTGIPTQFIIGRDGRIVAVVVGNGGKDDARTETALAAAGVKVDEAIVARGREQLEKAAAADRARAAAAATRPPFSENFGQLKAGEPVPDLALEDAAGQAVSLAALGRGQTVVLGIWSVAGVDEKLLALYGEWARKYADQGLRFLGLAAYGSREQYDQWRAQTADRVGFPVLFDPAGAPPQPGKPFDELTDDEKAAFAARQREHYPKVAPMKFTGGAMAPVPNTTVIDAQGRMVGMFPGFGPGTKESLGNLLLRAGIKLAPEDQPERVWTAAETKPPPPEPRREMLKIGAMAPDFTTQDLAGRAVKLSDFRGRVVVLDFWATWCGPCMTAMPHTQKVAAEYRDQGVVVLGSCTSDTRDAFERWVRANQEKYPDILWSHDPAGRGADRASLALYGVSGIPTQFIIDREGRVVDIVVGYIPGEVILDAALAKAGVKVDPALVEKAAADLERRAKMSGQVTPARALRPAPTKS